MKTSLFLALLWLTWSNEGLAQGLPGKEKKPSPPKATDLGAILGLTPENKNLPVWTAPSLEARQQLAQQTKALSTSVLLVGLPKKGHGTAWVLSREHRLLATNAHVADLFMTHGQMWALQHQSSNKWQVAKAWFHPGVRRYIAPGVSVRESDPKKGGVDGQSPDVAVLQLAPGGPPLPREFSLAGFDKIADLFAQPVAMIGFPAHDTKGLPADDSKPQATFHDGVISRLTDFRFFPGGPPSEQQFLQHTIQDWGGFSGSPIFLPTGEVVGLHNMARSEKGSFGDIRVIPHGVRVDCLLELLAHHQLQKLIAFRFDETKLNVKRWLQEDQRDKDMRLAMNIVAEARHELFNKTNPQAALELCDKAQNLAPHYPMIFATRSGCYVQMNYQGHIDKISKESRRRYLLQADDNAVLFAQKQGASDPYAMIVLASVRNNLGDLTGRERLSEEALAIAENLLNIPQLKTSQKGVAHGLMAHSYANLDETDLARKHDGLALQFNPDDPSQWSGMVNRSYYNASYRQVCKEMAELVRKKSRLLRETNNKDVKVIYDFKENITAKDERDGRGRNFHFYKFEVEKGYYYQIEMRTTAFQKEGDFDPFLILRDDNNKLIREDDDGLGLPHARIFFTAADSATYRLTVTTYNPGTTGNYHLVITRLAKDNEP